MSTSTATETQPHIAPDSENVHDAIRDLLADEYPDLATRHGGQVDRELYLQLSTATVIRYFKFIFKTWAGVASSFIRMLSFEISACPPPFLVVTPLVLTLAHVPRPIQLLGALGFF